MTHTSSTSSGVGLFSGFATFLQSIRLEMSQKARRARVYRTILAQLDAMTDSDLADIGITRFMITDVAADAAAAA